MPNLVTDPSGLQVAPVLPPRVVPGPGIGPTPAPLSPTNPNDLINPDPTPSQPWLPKWLRDLMSRNSSPASEGDSSEERDRKRCIARCDKDWDWDQKQCEWIWKTKGRDGNVYRVCIGEANRVYRECLQDCDDKKCK
jgi:hypothetical protein